MRTSFKHFLYTRRKSADKCAIVFYVVVTNVIGCVVALLFEYSVYGINLISHVIVIVMIGRARWTDSMFYTILKLVQIYFPVTRIMQYKFVWPNRFTLLEYRINFFLLRVNFSRGDYEFNVNGEHILCRNNVHCILRGYFLVMVISNGLCFKVSIKCLQSLGKNAWLKTWNSIAVNKTENDAPNQKCLNEQIYRFE